MGVKLHEPVVHAWAQPCMGANRCVHGCEPLCGRCAGKYPLEAVRTVASISRAAEAVFDHSSHYEVCLDRVNGGESGAVLPACAM